MLRTYWQKTWFILTVLAISDVLLLGIWALAWWQLRELGVPKLGAGLSVVTFVAAIDVFLIQYWESKREQTARSGRWSEHLLKMEDLARSMSTRYVGEFPTYLNDILELVGKAKHDLRILSDCADHGAFSNPALHRKVFRAIQ